MSVYTDLILATPGVVNHWACNIVDGLLPNSLAGPAFRLTNATPQEGPVPSEFAVKFDKGVEISTGDRIQRAVESYASTVSPIHSEKVTSISFWAIDPGQPDTPYPEYWFVDGSDGAYHPGESCFVIGPGMPGLWTIIIDPVPQAARDFPVIHDVEWHHYLAVIDRVTPDAKLFRDGVELVATHRGEGPIAPVDPLDRVWRISSRDLIGSTLSQIAQFNGALTIEDAKAQVAAMRIADIASQPPPVWVTPESGLQFVRIVRPSPAEQSWADMLAPAINSAIIRYLGRNELDPTPMKEVTAAAHRAFGYAWKMREAPFGQAQYLDDGGFPARMAQDWLEPIKPILDRYRNVAVMIG